MFRILLILFILVPLLEVWGILMVGQIIGGWPTFLLILLTGILGAYYAKKESKKVWRYAQEQLSMGQIPGLAILDAICVFVGGIMLLTPGFFTDILGILLVFPYSRTWFRALLLRYIKNYIEYRRIHFP